MPDAARLPSLQSIRDELTHLVEVVSPSVVTVLNSDAMMTTSSGSGWCFAPGIIVSNAHVVAGVSPIFKLRLKGGALVSARLIGFDTATDLAVLHTEHELTSLSVRHQAARLGELCCAFGSPLGEYPESVTLGIVSGLDRRLLLEDGWSIEGILQTDAEINHGNSGGPLVDINGEVLGVNTAIRRDGRGVGFAVPADTVLSIVPELIEHQRILRPRLGVTIDVIEHHADGISRERLRVCDVADARSSSFEPGDILLSIAGREVWSRADLFRTLRRPLIDSATTVVVERSTQLISLEIRCSASDEPASAE